MEHRVKSGWVRFLARGTHTGSVPDPGEQLPVIAPDEPYTNLTWRQQVPLPARDETMSFVLYGAEQLPYRSLVRDLRRRAPGGRRHLPARDGAQALDGMSRIGFVVAHRRRSDAPTTSACASADTVRS